MDALISETTIELEVDYDATYEKVRSSLSKLSEQVRLYLSQAPNWCILPSRSLPRGIARVEIILRRSDCHMAAFNFLKSCHLRPVFLPEFAALLACNGSKMLKLPCLGSLWTFRGSKKMLYWEAGTLFMCSHHTPFTQPGIFLPAVAYDDVDSLMRIPI